MPSPAIQDDSSRLRHADVIIAAAIAVVLVLWLTSLPLCTLNADEGINLMKARLVGEGYRLYRDIWSDQPALFTWLLAGWQRVFGDSLAASRALVVLFSGLLMLSLSRLVRHAGPPWVGLLALGLVLGSRRYVKLSVAVMIGLPAIATALCSLWLLAVHGRNHRWPWLVASAVLFAVSLQIKLFTFILLPVAVVMVVGVVKGRWGVMAWVGVVAGAFLALSLAAHVPPWDQLVTPHLGGDQPVAGRLAENGSKLLGFLMEDAPLTLLAAVGAAGSLSRGRRQVLLPLIWLGCSILALLPSQNIWSHHRLMLTVPLAAVAAIGLGELLGGPHPTTWRKATLAMLIVAAGLGIYRVGDQVWLMGRDGDDHLDMRILAAMRQHRDGTRWVVTDHPIYAYVTGLNVPPEVAVLSAKRVRQSGPPGELMRLSVERRHPEQILLARYSQYPQLAQVLHERYVLVAKSRVRGDARLLYLRADVARPAEQ